MTNLIGQNLGSYRIVEQVGRGGMATVYKAYQPAMDRYVAVKVLPAHFMQDPTFVERFEREARTIARLEHPHILPVHDYGKAPDGTTYIVMRYVNAGTLSDRLKQGPLSMNEIVPLFSQIGDALAYAHEQGIVHRDMKPSNILIDPHNQAFLTDFGLARIVEGDSHLTGSMIVGTPAYMAPEQGQGRPADKRSDIYALGIILYEMVTGRPPFEAETPMAVMIKHMTEPLPLPSQLNPDLSPAVERVILKALAKEPEGRYPSVTDMVRALQEAVTETPTLPSIPKPTHIPIQTAPVTPPKEARPAQRPAWLIPVLAGVGLLIVVAAAITLFFSRSTAPEKEQEALLPTTVVQATSELTVAPPPTEPAAPSPATEENVAPTEEIAEAGAESPSIWSQFSDTSPVNTLLAQGDLIWVGTEGGLLLWNRADGSYQKYTTLDGLPNHNILALWLASDGAVWAGTAGGGVVRITGEDWKIFNSEDGLTGDDVLSFLETGEGALLAGTAYGEQALSQFDGENWSAADLPPLPVEFAKPIALVQDTAGHLAVGLTDEGGLLILQDDQWQHITTADGLPSNTINDLAYDQAGSLWVATDQPGGTGIFDGTTFSASPELAEVLGSTLYVSSDGGLWLGTGYEGVWRFDGQSWSRYGENETLLRSDYITSLLQDDRGLLWVGASELGLFSFDGQTLQPRAIENEPAFNSAQQILEADDGRLWFVKKYGDPEIAIYSPTDDSWDTFETPGDTQAMALDPDGSFWFGTNDGLWQVTAEGEQQRFSTDDGLPSNNITALTFDDQDGLWVGAETGLVYHHPDDAGVPWRNFTDYIPSPHVASLYTDPTSQVWIGLTATDGRPAGVVRAGDGAIADIWLAGEETPEALQPIEPSIVGHPFPAALEEVLAFATDANGHLWMGSWNGGLWRFNPDSGEWRLFDQSDGATAANVLTITVDDDGTIWFGTWYDGLWGYNEAEGWWQDGPEDGLPSYGIFASRVASDGSLWVATDSGLARRAPE